MALSTPVLSETIVAQLTKKREALHQQFFDAFEKANVKLDPESLTREIIAQLNEERREIVVKLLGFNDRWGKLEVDSCNGRDRESIVGKYLRIQAQAAVQAWMDKHLLVALEKHIKGKFSDPKVISASVKAFDKYFSYALDDCLRSHATDAATEIAADFAAKVKESMSLSAEEGQK